jgi:hypothetical protein
LGRVTVGHFVKLVLSLMTIVDWCEGRELTVTSITISGALDNVLSTAAADVQGVVIIRTFGTCRWYRGLCALAVVGRVGDCGRHSNDLGSSARTVSSNGTRSCWSRSGRRGGRWRRKQSCAPDVAVLIGGTNPILQVAVAVPGYINTLRCSSTGLDTIAEILRTTDNSKIVIVSVDTALDDEVARRGAEGCSVVGIAGWA